MVCGMYGVCMVCGGCVWGMNGVWRVVCVYGVRMVCGVYDVCAVCGTWPVCVCGAHMLCAVCGTWPVCVVHVLCAAHVCLCSPFSSTDIAGPRRRCSAPLQLMG